MRLGEAEEEIAHFGNSTVNKSHVFGLSLLLQRGFSLAKYKAVARQAVHHIS